MLKEAVLFSSLLLLACQHNSQIEANSKQKRLVGFDTQQQKCIGVSADELYRDHRSFNNKLVCASGELEASHHSTYLLPDDKSLTEDRYKLLALDVPYYELLQEKLKTGDRVSVVGIFTYDRECFGEFDSLEEETVCAPAQYQMYLNAISSIERLAE